MAAPEVINITRHSGFILAAAAADRKAPASGPPMFRYVWLEPFGATVATDGFVLAISLDTHAYFDGPAVGVRLDKALSKNSTDIALDLNGKVARYGNGKVVGMEVAAAGDVPLVQYANVLPDNFVTIVTGRSLVGVRHLMPLIEVAGWYQEKHITFDLARKGSSSTHMDVMRLSGDSIICSSPIRTDDRDGPVVLPRWAAHDGEALQVFIDTDGKQPPTELYANTVDGLRNPAPLDRFITAVAAWNEWRNKNGLEPVREYRGVAIPDDRVRYADAKAIAVAHELGVAARVRGSGDGYPENDEQFKALLPLLSSGAVETAKVAWRNGYMNEKGVVVPLQPAHTAIESN